ncbi:MULTISPECIES: helix-turn-helix domain-containing protein [unclassified Ruegeria]|uniref:helix-turn-helix domain-containing protein n=2 Tax=Ruegeria TaxID=97050 RepID=UPI00148812C3|nr:MULTISPECIES: helix-turn-helix transcriptional regulator [unclassified Ruegeria]NOD33515.1 helix-turn-helix domain-containing protein [Ruegeria sp. HKCCD7296]NOE40810.1 helix-turn-helix domain-containing protein [Ruegeria sp. HKCCD7319]
MKIRIKEIRQAKGLTQDELAVKVDLSRSYLAQLEKGKRPLTTKKQAIIAAALDVEPTELVDFSAPDKDEEVLLLEAFRALSPEQRKAWLEWAKVAKGSALDKE